jgi:hypothetical protein
MARRTKQGLDDVKLTLQRLQRIAIDPSSDIDAEAKPGASATPGGPAIEAARLDAAEKSGLAGALTRRNTLFGVGGALLVVAVAGGLLLFPRSGPKPQPTAATAVDLPVRRDLASLPPISPPPASLQGIAEAEALLDAGKVTNARRILADMAPQSAEAALMLARSYDPNHLQQLVQPDAAPDPAEAERWYRTWHEIAAKGGLVMEADRLERIIKAMK